MIDLKLVCPSLFKTEAPEILYLYSWSVTTHYNFTKTISILLVRSVCATLIFTGCLMCLWLASISLSTKKNIILYCLRRIIQPYFLSCSYHGYTYDYGHSAMPKGLHSVKTLWALSCKISVPEWQAAEYFIMEKLWCWFGSFYKIKHLHKRIKDSQYWMVQQ